MEYVSRIWEAEETETDSIEAGGLQKKNRGTQTRPSASHRRRVGETPDPVCMFSRLIDFLYVIQTHCSCKIQRSPFVPTSPYWLEQVRDVTLRSGIDHRHSSNRSRTRLERWVAWMRQVRGNIDDKVNESRSVSPPDRLASDSLENRAPEASEFLIG